MPVYSSKIKYIIYLLSILICNCSIYSMSLHIDLGIEGDEAIFHQTPSGVSDICLKVNRGKIDRYPDMFLFQNDKYPLRFIFNLSTGRFDGDYTAEPSQNLNNPEEIQALDVITLAKQNSGVLLVNPMEMMTDSRVMKEFFTKIYAIDNSLDLFANIVLHPLRCLSIFAELVNKCKAWDSNSDLIVNYLQCACGLKKYEPILKRVQCIILVGVNSDEFGLLNEYRKIHPGGKIAAINPEIPDYLQNSDFFVNGYTLEILPVIMEGLKT